jgi:hypothetical protein
MAGEPAKETRSTQKTWVNIYADWASAALTRGKQQRSEIPAALNM